MASKSLSIALFLISFPPLLQSQQPYEGQGISDCASQHNSTSLLGYFCNPRPASCPSFLTFPSQPPYQSVSAISALLNSDPSRLSRLNSVPLDHSFPANAMVVVPVTCSCSGAYYQANSSYVVKNQDTYFTIANNTLQGLTSCQALQQQNNMPSSSLLSGMRIAVPLRCACPTDAQMGGGAKYLLSYLVGSGETVFVIGQKLGVNLTIILEANGLSATDTVYPFTTLLIPLKTEPSDSQVTNPPPPPTPPPPSTPPPAKKSNHAPVYVGIGVSVLVFVIIGGAALFYVRFKAKKKDGSKPPAKLSPKSPPSSSELFTSGFARRSCGAQSSSMAAASAALLRRRASHHLLRRSSCPFLLRTQPASHLHTHATSFGFKEVHEDEKSKLVGNVFSSVATNYDLMNDFMSVGLHRLWKDRLVSKLHPFPGMKHLDVAGGTGDVAFRVLDRINSVGRRAMEEKLADIQEETQIYVCDVNPKMLNVGKKRSIERGLGEDCSLVWVEGDAEALSFGNESMDGYTIAFGIRNVTHIEKALMEAYRVLRRGGRFLCLELSHVDMPIFKQLYDYYSFSVIPAMGELVAGDRDSYQYLVESVRRFPTQETFARMIADAGFQKVEYENLVGGVVAIHSGLKTVEN